MYTRVYGGLRAFEAVCEGGLKGRKEGVGGGFDGGKRGVECIEVGGKHMYRNQTLWHIGSTTSYRLSSIA